MRKITLAAIAALSLWIATAEFASAQIAGGSEDVCSQTAQTGPEAFCCSHGYFPGTASYDCCLKNPIRLVGRVCPKEPALPPPAIVPVCGNGLLESGESCDDGNVTDGDGCSSDCKTPGAICSALFSDSSDDFNCCVDHVNAGLPADGCPAPEEPQTLPTTENPTTPPISEPVEPAAPVVPVADNPATDVAAGTLTCEVAREEDVGPSGKIIAVSTNGLVPFVIRYSNPSAFGALPGALKVDLRQSEGLPVAITDLNEGSESFAGKSLTTGLTLNGEAEWVVYLSRPTSLVGDWDPDASFEVTVKDASGSLARLETACLAAAHVQGGQGGCALGGPVPREGKALELGLVSLATFALALLRSRKSTAV